MWPFADRRRSRRYVVDWKARMQLVVPGRKMDLDTRIVTISLRGAGLALERMQVGSYHLVIGERPDKVFLSIPLPEGTVESAIEIKCYDWSDSLKAFSVGVEFVGMGKEMEALLRRAVKGLPAA